MSVRAKFKVDQIRRHKYGDREMQTVELSPVYSSDPKSENKAFWDATPSGRLELGCINLDAARSFELGAEYYIDISKAG